MLSIAIPRIFFRGVQSVPKLSFERISTCLYCVKDKIRATTVREWNGKSTNRLAFARGSVNESASSHGAA